MFVRLLQLENTDSPIVVTLFGIVTLVKPVQPWNVEGPMLVTPLGIVTLERLVQPENAEPPMEVTLFVKFTCVNKRHRSKAPYPIEEI